MYTKLYCSGVQPGIMYRIPKIPKPNEQLRPIFAAYKAPAYSIAKYLASLLNNHTLNEYTTKNSKKFQSSIISYYSLLVLYLASFDTQILFKNIHLYETVDLLCSKTFATNIKFHGMDKSDFKALLSLAC